MNYILLARTGKKLAYITSTRFGTTSNDINEAARIVQEKSASDAIKVLISERDYERKNNCKLSYARINTVIVEEKTVEIKASKPGWIIKREDEVYRGPYSTAPLKPKDGVDFSHAYYAHTPNKDKATRYKSKEAAEARIAELIAVLKEAADREDEANEFRSHPRANTYRDVEKRFKAVAIEV